MKAQSGKTGSRATAGRKNITETVGHKAKIRNNGTYRGNAGRGKKK